jgi:hypothetical protein
MSALAPKADMVQQDRDVYFVPKADVTFALRQDAARHDAAVKNMQRLRALRLATDAKAKSE